MKFKLCVAFGIPVNSGAIAYAVTGLRICRNLRVFLK